MPDFTVVVPIFEETDALDFSIAWFRKHGVKPLYVLDSKMAHRQRELERLIGLPVPIYQNSTGFAEGNFTELANLSPTDWILRIDCDEVPNAAMLDHCSRFVKAAPATTCGFDRDDMVWRGDHFDKLKHGWLFFDSQHRLFNRRKVKFAHRIHTPGYEIAKWKIPLVPLWHAPLKARIYHLQREFTSRRQFEDKMRRYVASGQDASTIDWRSDSELPWLPHNDEAFSSFYRDWKSCRKKEASRLKSLVTHVDRAHTAEDSKSAKKR